jgi:methylmalonyl-CoA mutase N-terminal domain/subunit
MADDKKIITTSGIEIAEQYDRPPEGFDPQQDLGDAGACPFTRGVYPGMYRRRLWTMRQYAGFGTAAESNERYRYLLKQGQTGLSVAFDLPTQIGYDSDHELAAGEVGKTGVAIDGVWDMETLFDGIPLDKVSVSMTINSTAAILLALLIAVAKKQGVATGQLSGTIQNDILKEFIARGTYIYPPAPSMRLIADTISYCREFLPKWNPISISGYHVREAGCTAAQEIAFTLANGIAYVENALAAGLKIDEFAGRLSFFFNAHNDFFEEIAKFRAARRLWAQIMKDRFQAKDETSMRLRFHTQTAGSMLTAQQPDVNIPRVTLQALAAVLGGTQSLHTNSADEALALPSAHAAEIALRTQQVIAYESGVTNTVDPLAGSYYIEHLTDELESRARKYISQIDELGGAVAAVEQGFYQREIQKAAWEWQQAVERGERTIIGINKFAAVNELERTGLLQVDEHLDDEQKKRLRKHKAARNQGMVKETLRRLQQAAAGNSPLMPHILECVENCCTLGEIADVFRNVWGEYRETVII